VTILLVTPTLSVRMGGSVASMIVLAKSLALKHQVEVWTTDYEFLQSDTTLRAACEIRVFRLVSDHFFLAPGMLPTLLRDHSRFDAISVFHPWTMTGLVGGLVAPSAQCPVLIHTQGMLLPVALGHHAVRKRLAVALGARHLLNRFTAAIACNPVELPSIRRWGFRKPVHVLPNAVIPVATKRGVLRTELDLPEDVKIVAYMNRFDPIKRVIELCGAFRSVQDCVEGVVFLFAGDATTPYGREVQTCAARAGLRARFLGHLGPKEKWNLLADANVLCQYSAQEGHSNSLTEALAAGVPIVASRPCNFSEIGTKGAGFVIDSVEEMAEATVRLLADDYLRRTMSANALQLAQNYTPKAVAATYARIVGECASSGAPDALEVVPAQMELPTNHPM